MNDKEREYYKARKEKELTYCGLRNDVTGYDIGDTYNKVSKDKYFIHES